MSSRAPRAFSWAWRQRAACQGKAPIDFPQETAIGALGLYVSNESVGSFQPMNINFGIMPQLGYRVKGKRNKNAELSKRSLEKIGTLQEEVLAK